MSDVMRVSSIRKKFRTLVPNWNDDKAVVRRSSGDSVDVIVIVRGKLKPLTLTSNHQVEQWVNHLIDYFLTGKFDTNAYFMPYEDKYLEDEPTPFPCIHSFGNDFYTHSDESMKWADDYRKQNPLCGFKVVPKPLDYTLIKKGKKYIKEDNV